MFHTCPHSVYQRLTFPSSSPIHRFSIKPLVFPLKKKKQSHTLLSLSSSPPPPPLLSLSLSLSRVPSNNITVKTNTKSIFNSNFWGSQTCFFRGRKRERERERERKRERKRGRERGERGEPVGSFRIDLHAHKCKRLCMRTHTRTHARTHTHTHTHTHTLSQTYSLPYNCILTSTTVPLSSIGWFNGSFGFNKKAARKDTWWDKSKRDYQQNSGKSGHKDDAIWVNFNSR